MSNSCFDPCSRHHSSSHDKERKCCENKIDIDNNIHIKQNAFANGGDGGDGGNSGDTLGGSAAAAAAVDGSAAASSETETESGYESNKEYDFPPKHLRNQSFEERMERKEPKREKEEEESACADADGGDANGGNGGDGGNGGNGGESTNSATVYVENVVVINCDEKHGPSSLTLGTNGRKFDISVDQQGNTLVNGKKMDEKTFEDGTKVFIFRNSESNTTNF